MGIPASTPPSMTNSAPVQKLDSSDARKVVICAISSGCPTRPSVASRARYGFGSNPSFASDVMGVSIAPGWTELTRMPDGPGSNAAVLVRPRTANLLDTYAPVAAAPAMPLIDEKLTIEPPPADRIGAITARTVSY